MTGVFTAVPGATDPSSTSWKYQWYRVSSKGKVSSISHATKSTYTPTSSSVGYRVKVRVTNERAGYNSVSKYSSVTAVVMEGLAAVTPKLCDTTPTVGQVLSITDKTSVGKWAPQPVTGKYQWLRNGSSRRPPTCSADHPNRRGLPFWHTFSVESDAMLHPDSCLHSASIGI